MQWADARGRKQAQQKQRGRRVKVLSKASRVEGALPMACTQSMNKKPVRALSRGAKGSSWCLEATPTP